MMMSRNMMRSLAVAMVSVGAAGCVNVLPAGSPAAVRYDLTPVSFEANDAVMVEPWSLAIADPTATRAYDTARIALSREAGQIEYYAGGEWADRGPGLWLTALVRSFENSGRILNVGDNIALPGADYTLQTDLRDFHVVHDGRDRAVVVTVYAKLSDRRGRIQAAQLFQSRQKLKSEAPSAVARAFNEAVSNVIGALAPWSLDAGARAYQEKNNG